MGGRGGSSGMVRPRRIRTQNTQQGGSQTSQQAPTTFNTPLNPNALDDMSNMTDQELAALVNSSKGIDMPNMLADVHDSTQEFVYAAGLNEKPQVLDDDDFDQYLKDNNIPNRQILSRSVDPITYKNKDNTTVSMTADEVSRMLKDSRFNYIGGKHGGNLHGSGTYFDMNGGVTTGYGGLNSSTINAVLSKNAKVVKESDLFKQSKAFSNSHPQFVKAVGKLDNTNESIYALAMGYNTINAGSYYNVIDRSALVIKKNDHGFSY